MKTFRIILKSMLFFLAVQNAAGVAIAQSSKQERAAEKAAVVKNMVTAQNYVFKAQMALPMGGRSRYLTSDYELTVSRDSIETYLPYFGRAYTAPANLTGGGIQFKSKNFDYTLKDRKKGGWDVTIKPKDVRDIQQLSLSISESGYASLQVISNSRQPISFNGYIAEKSQKKQ